jgi:hypothetical protein
VAPGALSRGNGGIPHYSMRKHRHQCSMCEKNQDDGRQSFAPRLSRLTDMVDSTCLTRFQRLCSSIRRFGTNVNNSIKGGSGSRDRGEV